LHGPALTSERRPPWQRSDRFAALERVAQRMADTDWGPSFVVEAHTSGVAGLVGEERTLVVTRCPYAALLDRHGGRDALLAPVFCRCARLPTTPRPFSSKAHSGAQ